MAPKVLISKFVFQRLKGMKTPFRGCLYGVEKENSRVILGFTVSTPPEDEVSPFEKATCELEKITNNLPAGVEFCGYIAAEEDVPDVQKLVPDMEDTFLLACSFSGEHKAGFVAKRSFSKVTIDVLEDMHELYLVKVHYKERIALKASQESVREYFLKIREKLSCGKIVFHQRDSDLFIGSSTDEENDETVDDVFSRVSGGKSKKENEQRSLHLDTLVNVAEERDEGKVSFKIKFSPARRMTVPLHLEGVALVPSGSTQLYDLCVEALERNLQLVEEAHRDIIEKDDDVLAVKTYCVQLNDFGHTFLCAWPIGIESGDAKLKEKRRMYHKILGLPLTRPHFRRMNAGIDGDPKILQNTHIGLKGQLAGGQQYLVQGTYGYYHYMQQNYDDSGWGCAYRSLQTIFSWFRHQGYTEKPIPSHYDIQEALVSIGDKPRAFLGSKQWIGSTEVSLCLEKFLNISSRIMFVQSGAELAHKGAELAMHFESQGTPIMIGGGVLAHTIIGIDYNRLTGELKFLILDPHYTGAEDLSTIQHKGFCSWKTINFWDKKSYYNLCMPIRPIEF
uniref:Probable Ufm1-specific protease 2 n=1 Tax=Nyssomyia neivai TaxID=330878 RepID=A0A1L8DTK0_9DIPT